MEGVGRSLIIPLNGGNYNTWKIQVRMLLVNQGLWGLVSGVDSVPTTAEALAIYNAKRGRALSTIVLSLSPSLLYLIGNPEDPQAVWTTLENHFHKSSWSNQFSLRKKLYSMKMSDDCSVRDHIRMVTELFDNLAAVDDPLKDKDRVMILMSSLPCKFDVLVTALQSNKDIPTWEDLVEKLVAEECRQLERKPEPNIALYSEHTKPKRPNTKRDVVCYY